MMANKVAVTCCYWGLLVLKHYISIIVPFMEPFRAQFSEKGRVAERGWKRVSYLGRMFLAELGLSQWTSREFWAMLLLFVFTFFLRIYLHYTGQYMFLLALGIPVNRSVDLYDDFVPCYWTNGLLMKNNEDGNIRVIVVLFGWFLIVIIQFNIYGNF